MPTLSRSSAEMRHRDLIVLLERLQDMPIEIVPEEEIVRRIPEFCTVIAEVRVSAQSARQQFGARDSSWFTESGRRRARVGHRHRKDPRSAFEVGAT